MAFSNVKLSQVKEKYGLDEDKQDIFPTLEFVAPTDWLQDMIATASELPLLSEKVKCEAIIYPILIEVWKRENKRFAIFSGVSLDVSAELKGECDFILSKMPKNQEIEAPIFTLIEAKDDNIKNGLGQCALQMYAAQKFNDSKGKSIATIYGCITTGEAWQFLKLEGNMLTFHEKRFYLVEINKILGVFSSIIKEVI